MSRPAVFLDRDGTLIEERHYPTRREDLVILPGVPRALCKLREAGLLLLILTNQSAVARGLINEETLGELHEDLLARLARAGGKVDGLYYAPHHPDGVNTAYAWDSPLRKPGTGMVDLAVHEHDVDLSRSAFIGDAPRDLAPGLAGVGARILVRSGHELTDVSLADHVAEDFPAAVTWLLDHLPEPQPASAPSGDVPHQ